MYSFDSLFPKYTEHDPQVPVWCLTPNTGYYTHRFFDTTPISPSGRYLAVLNMPFEDRYPTLGDAAEVIIVDLLTGDERVVAKTFGWEHQLGANINWGVDDTQLIYNDVNPDDSNAFAVSLSWQTGEKKRLGHEIYHVSPNGKMGVSANLHASKKTQFGYGVPTDEKFIPKNTIETEDDGVWLIDTKTGEHRLLLSLRHIFEATHSPRELQTYRQGLCYVFHTKWSPDNKKIMFSTRWVPPYLCERLGTNSNELRFCVYTCDADGRNLEIAIDETQWVKGGHHTTWSPDSSYLTMNLNIETTGMHLCRASLTGRHIEKLFDDIIGSGHPSLHRSGKLMITDSYAQEPVAFGDGTVPIRVINVENEKELPPAVRIKIDHSSRNNGPFLRVDPHPVWDRTGRYCCNLTDILKNRTYHKTVECKYP